MDSIYFIVWLMPIIYMLNNFEEIFMLEVWSKRNKSRIDTNWPKKTPLIITAMFHCRTPAFAFSVYILFTVTVVISFLSAAYQNYFLWYGVFAGITLHFIFVHVPLCIKMKCYVPGICSSLILLVPSVWFMYRATVLLHYNATTILLAMLLGIAVATFAIWCVHKKMGNWSEKLYQYSHEQAKKLSSERR